MDTLFTKIDVDDAPDVDARGGLDSSAASGSDVSAPRRTNLIAIAASLIALGVAAGVVLAGPRLLLPPAPVAAAAPPPSVAVSLPLKRDVAGRLEFLGQFSAVEQVDLRAQVGGPLVRIGFKDGEIVAKGDLLFEIDPTPYEIKLDSASAQLEAARARLDLAGREFVRADQLKKTGYGSVETADQRAADQRAAQGAVDEAQAAVRDAQFDLNRARIVAPFTGRIGSHQVTVGNLISGSRFAASPTTLLATIVSTDDVYLNFDMSEADYMTFLRHRPAQKGALADAVEIELADETSFTRHGTLDFVDNRLDRASGVIHARATVPNSDGLLTPGGFARVRLDVGAPSATLLVPDAAVMPDQSNHIVLTVGANNIVVPKPVQLGELRDGLRVIRSGLAPSDRVVVSGVPLARPGAPVAPQIQAMKFVPATD